jgi:uncharacterized protein (DUF2141 family)
MKIRLLLLTLVCSLSAVIARANNTTPPGNGEESKKTDLTGGVVHSETRKPLGQVNVIAYSANKKEKVAITDQHGFYSFNDLKPGTYRLVFEKDGYRKVTKEKVAIRGDEGCQLNIEMEEYGDNNIIIPGGLFFE